MAQEQDNEQQGQQPQNARPSLTNNLTGGMVKDPVDPLEKPSTYFNAINATTILPDGQVGALHTEPSNTLVLNKFPLIYIGGISLSESQSIQYWTDNTVSEIGLYTETTNTYQILINDAATLAAGLPGMGFKTTNLITGEARRGYDCGFDVYWSDGRLNPNRFFNTATCPFSINSQLIPNPWFQTSVTVAGCITFTNTDLVDINQLRLAPVFNVPCLKLSKGGSGILDNGNYQVAVAYTINGFKCTDYMAVSNQQSLWSHIGSGGGLILTLSNLETVIFREMEVVVISMIGQQVQARSFGIYDTTQTTIYIDNINNELRIVPIQDIPISTPAIVASDSIWGISNYLLQLGPTERPDINYQPFANQISVNWACIMYPEQYYHQGGMTGLSAPGAPLNVGYMRDEVYALYIRGVYTTGDKTASYSIPGISPISTPGPLSITAHGGSCPQVGDGSVTIATGTMAVYESLEIYQDDLPQVWNSNVPGHLEWNLCGQPIRHHKFPDVSDFGGAYPHYTTIGDTSYIQIMGLVISNIQPFRDLQGNIIADIQGYEILRATRDGNESVIAKGMVNNMGQATDNTGQNVLFSNFPNNDLRINKYLTTTINDINNGVAGPGYSGNGQTTFRSDYLSFHGPETIFQKPYLGTGTLKFTLGMYGTSRGIFTTPYQHPMFKVLSDFDSILGDIITALELVLDIATTISILGGGSPPNITIASTEAIPLSFPMFLPVVPDTSNVDGTTLPVVTAAQYAAAIANGVLFAAFSVIQIQILQQQILTIIKGLIPGRQYAVQYDSAGFYDQNAPIITSTNTINDYQYILGQMQAFQGNIINNIYRNNYVCLQLDGNSDTSWPLNGTHSGAPSGYVPTGDQSRFLLSEAPNPNQLNNWQSSNIASYYATYKVSQPTQYGQVDSPKQVPISCMFQMTPTAGAITYTTPILFGGDTYINRYTEKNPMFFFNDWLLKSPEDIAYDYRDYINVPYPMFWLNNFPVYYGILALAHQNRRLDGPLNVHTFYVDSGYFYLFNNGIRDFFVESTINVGYRDYGESIPEQFYNPYGFTDIQQMFRSDIIKSPEFYKYDYSLSANKFWNQWLTWSKCLRRDFNPQLAYTCFAYYPRRLTYSLPQSEEQVNDNWRLFLPNNYIDLPTKVTAVKDISQTGAIILLDDMAPLQLPGVQSIPSINGTEFSTGTGELFKQQLQSITNVDNNYQYGSCQSKYSVISTPYGIFWTSQRTGKVFQDAPGKAYYNQGERTIDITAYGLKYWMAQYLPCMLTTYFPDFPLTDNPVAGVGTQLIYDPTNELLYICKKDYVPRSEFDIAWSGTEFQLISGAGISAITLGDPNYFTDASWTLSFSPKEKKFISFHSWEPTLNIAAQVHFLTVNGSSVWRHNTTTGSFCNFYGVQYGFEVEVPLNSGMEITTIENIEYVLDSFNYKPNQSDKFNLYADTFNEAQVFNEEQSTLPLFLSQKLWNNPYDGLNYPSLAASGLGMNVQFTKVENKFRFTYIRDYTYNRSQFDLGTVQMKLTQPNGYKWDINLPYFDFYKSPFQLKKIRHRASRLLLRKTDITVNSCSLLNISTNVLKSYR